MLLFNPPPGWPPAAKGWLPPPGWRPDPGLPPPPANWQFVISSHNVKSPGATAVKVIVVLAVSFALVFGAAVLAAFIVPSMGAYSVDSAQTSAVSVAESVGRDAIALAAFESRSPVQLNLESAVSERSGVVIDQSDTFNDSTPNQALLMIDGVGVVLVVEGQHASAYIP